MRFSPSILFVAIGTSCIVPQSGRAQEAADQLALQRARRELAAAKMELRQYWLVEYPRQRRQLNAAIDLTDAEIRNYRARLLAYEPYNHFSRGNPYLITVQEVRMCLREAELRQRDLWAERNALVRLHSDQWRLLEMQVHEARLRVIELEPDEPEDEEPVALDVHRVAAKR